MPTIPDTYPLARTNDCNDSLEEAKLFSALDALRGYWRVPIENDNGKTAFTSHLGTYRYSLTPFGLKMRLLRFDAHQIKSY